MKWCRTGTKAVSFSVGGSTNTSRTSIRTGSGGASTPCFVNRLSRAARAVNGSRDGLDQPAIAPLVTLVTAAATLSVNAAGNLPSATNAGFGTAPVSNSLVSPRCSPTGANTAWAVLYDDTSAIAPVRSFSPTRAPKNCASTSDSSIALSTKPASLQPVATYASFLPFRACIESPTLEYNAHVRAIAPPIVAFASSFQPRFTA